MTNPKESLRACAKARRSGLPESDIRSKSLAITDSLLSLLNGYSPVMCYVSKPPEVVTTGLIGSLMARGTRVIVPIIQRDSRTLRLSYLDSLDALVESTFHVPEPIGREIPARPDEIAAAVIPLIGFDAAGNRLGYGAGYYDRFLSDNPNILKIGIAFSCQQIEAIPADANDIGMDYIVTEAGIHRCSRVP